MRQEITSGAPPMLGAEVRVARARQLLGTLKRQLQGWADAHSEFLAAKQDEETGRLMLYMAYKDARRLARISVTIGETVYNLRAALDYVIHDLARLTAGGKPVRGTQFPIEHSPADFAMRITGKDAQGKRVGHFLKGVPPGALPYIRKLQPFDGCRWTKELQELSNPDKHRHLSSLRSTAEAKIHEAEVVATDPETGKHTVDIKFNAEVEVFFPDGRPVLETLQALCREVKTTVALFKSRIEPL